MQRVQKEIVQNLMYASVGYGSAGLAALPDHFNLVFAFAWPVFSWH
jgi:hypothetical protein